VTLQKPTQLPLNIVLSDFATFENFYQGHNQKLALFLKNFVADFQPTNSIVYLWGVPDSGRTHLLQASCRLAGQLDFSSVYLPLAKLNEFSEEVFEGLEAVDLICLDDIGKIIGKDNWEQIIFKIVNNAYANKQKLLVTANCLPKALAINLEDLRSRLLSGLIFEVFAMTDVEKLKAMMLWAGNRGIILSEKVGRFLLSRYSRSASQLFNVLETLDKQSLIKKRELTVKFVKEVLNL
jgi:DnaA family protein